MKLQNKAVLLFTLAIGSSAFMLFRRRMLDLIWASEKRTQPGKRLLVQTFHHQEFVQTNTNGFKSLPFQPKIAKIQKSNSDSPDTQDSQACFYQYYNLERPRTISLMEDKTDYFLLAGQTRCLREGTAKTSPSGCSCKSGWHGTSCSIPDIVNEKEFLHPTKLHLRDSAPRRIIYGMTFNMEFEMLEIRLEEMGDLIDAIIILESNYTGFGDKKELHLLNKMRNGFLKQFQQKIVYLHLNYFPTDPSDPKNGLYTDTFMKNHLSKVGLGLLKGTKEDDIFIFADADEIHRREALLFLKLHDDYPEPFGVNMRQTTFGFFWSSGETTLGIGCSLAMLNEVYQNKCKSVRDVANYVQRWHIGQLDPSPLIGGWHCSWCFEPERVRTKLLSAFNYDFPRWGNFPDKTNLDYIQNLIRKGQWFDDETNFTAVYIGPNVPYAPSCVLNNMSRYLHLLFNPFKPL